MTYLWPDLATFVGISVHVIAFIMASYVGHWCMLVWRRTRIPVAFAAFWLMVVIALLSVYRFCDLTFPENTMAHDLAMEFGLWVRIGLASTLTYLAWYVWKLGRPRRN